jgi:putative transcriptional regulator
MSRDVLINNIISMLLDAGFIVSDRCVIRPKSFDIAARREEQIFLIKVLGNVDALNRQTGMAMQDLGIHLNANPLVISLRTRDKNLEPGVVYLRHGVPVISPDTAYDLFIEEIPPLIYAAPGGLYVPIDGEYLSKVRRELKWSLGKLAMMIGVSRRTVSKYENGMDASIEVAIRLEELFGSKITIPIGIFGRKAAKVDIGSLENEQKFTQGSDEMIDALNRFGFIVHPTDRAPFQAVSEHSSDSNRILITGHSQLTKTAIKRAKIMGSIGHVTKAQSIYFVDGKVKQKYVEETILISKNEIDSIDGPEAFNELLREKM